MAKRLSSFFSLSRDDKDASSSGTSQPSAAASSHYPSLSQTSSSSPHKLHKHHLTASSDLDLDRDLGSTLPPLAPPPLLSKNGFSRPPSSQRSGPDSRPGSRASSRQSRDGSRSRPHTPRLSMPAVASSPPVRPTSPQGVKIKKKGWLPGKTEAHKSDGQGQQKAWIAGLRDYVGYDLTALLTGNRVCIPIYTEVAIAD